MHGERGRKTKCQSQIKFNGIKVSALIERAGAAKYNHTSNYTFDFDSWLAFHVHVCMQHVLYKLDGKGHYGGYWKVIDGIDEVAVIFKGTWGDGGGGGALSELLKCKRLDLRDKQVSALTTSFFFGVTPYVVPPKKVVKFFTGRVFC